MEAALWVGVYILGIFATVTLYAWMDRGMRDAFFLAYIGFFWPVMLVIGLLWLAIKTWLRLLGLDGDA